MVYSGKDGKIPWRHIFFGQDQGSVRKVTLTIKNKVNSVKTNALEGVTDIKWEKEIGPSYAADLVNKTLKEEVNKAAKEANTCFVGSGFKPIAEAGAFIQSITTEDTQGFIDPMAQAVLAANGQAFVPTGAPDALYGKGTLGNFQGIDYKAERWLSPVKVNLTVASAGVQSYALPRSVHVQPLPPSSKE